MVVRTGSGGKSDNSGAVVWLKPVGEPPPVANIRSGLRFRIVQQNKRFEPHILAIPVGSIVDFPNLDPFFHNVFSMFDGKKFDLGLYEAGASHSVTFARPGVSYIFCNIHPEMSAAIVVTDSPYYAVSGAGGEFSIPNVAPGRYLVTVWHERAKLDAASGYPREVIVSATSATLPVIRLIDSAPLLMPHKNKYGRDYDIPSSQAPPYK